MTWTPLHRIRRKMHDIDSLNERSGFTLKDYVDLGELRTGTAIADLEQIYDEARACPDCGHYRSRYYGPVDFDGVLIQHGDFVCRQCAESRGVQTHG